MSSHVEYVKDLYGKFHLAYAKEKTKIWRIVMEDYTVIRELGDVRGKRVLDIACGDGNMGRKLLERGAVHVDSVDISPEMLQLAKQLSRDVANITFSVGNCLDLEQMKQLLPAKEQSYDIITASWLLGNAANLAEVANLARVINHFLSPQGICAGGHLCPSYHPNWKAHITHWPFLHEHQPIPTEDGWSIKFDSFDVDDPEKIALTVHMFDFPESELKRVFAEQSLTIDFPPMELDPKRKDAEEKVQCFLKNTLFTVMVVKRDSL